MAGERCVCCLLVVHRVHMLDEAEHLVAVAVLVVVPADDLHEVIVQGDAGGGVGAASLITPSSILEIAHILHAFVPIILFRCRTKCHNIFRT